MKEENTLIAAIHVQRFRYGGMRLFSISVTKNHVCEDHKAGATGDNRGGSPCWVVSKAREGGGNGTKRIMVKGDPAGWQAGRLVGW